ncbi:hypothetical protein ACJMK2_009476 [Sinanodonta woodiana]|uniref:Uncharacterized protein n=1 Tax=Sinanodonta woodiana TaxID=1069815 RepID=A0ABD3VCC8_SINWO
MEENTHIGSTTTFGDQEVVSSGCTLHRLQGTLFSLQQWNKTPIFGLPFPLLNMNWYHQVVPYNEYQRKCEYCMIATNVV